MQTFKDYLHDYGADQFSDLALDDAEALARQMYEDFENKVSSLEQDIADEDAARERLQGQLDDTESEAETARDELNTAIETHQNEVEDLENRIAELEAQLAG